MSTYQIDPEKFKTELSYSDIIAIDKQITIVRDLLADAYQENGKYSPGSLIESLREIESTISIL